MSKDVNDQIKEIDARIAKIRQDKDKILKEQAVLEHQYDSVVEELKKHGIEVEEMKASQVQDLVKKLSSELEADLESLEASVGEAEGILKEFKEMQG